MRQLVDRDWIYGAEVVREPRKVVIEHLMRLDDDSSWLEAEATRRFTHSLAVIHDLVAQTGREASVDRNDQR